MNPESKFEHVIGWTLIIGVSVSMVLEVIGMILFDTTYGDLHISEAKLVFIRGRNFFDFVLHLFSGQRSRPILFMTLGIAVLMLTPYVRVVLSVFFFLWEKNFQYVIITLFVLALLTVSLAVR